MVRFKVGTFNVLNLALPGQKTYSGDEPYSEAEFQEKTRWIAGQLQKMAPHIVGFQEVWHLDALKAAVARWNSAAQVFVAQKPEDGPRVALATTLEVLQISEHRDFPPGFELSVSGLSGPVTAFNRSVLQADLKLPDGGPELTVFVAHLKSKRPMVESGKEGSLREEALGSARSLMVRAAEAYALRTILLGLLQKTHRPVFLLGDLNDSAHAVTTEIVSGTPPMLYWPEERRQAVWDVLLYNAFDIQARQNTRRDVSYSHIFNGFYDTLDQIYVSQEFNRQNPKRLGEVEYVHYFNDHLVDRTLSRERPDRIQSDHGQVVATLRLRDEPPREEPGRNAATGLTCGDAPGSDSGAAG